MRSFRTPIGLRVLALLILGSWAPSWAGCWQNGPDDPSRLSGPLCLPPDSVRTTVLRMVNELRAGQGLPALAWDERIVRAARTHSESIAKKRGQPPYENDVLSRALAAEGFKARQTLICEMTRVDSLDVALDVCRADLAKRAFESIGAACVSVDEAQMDGRLRPQTYWSVVLLQEWRQAQREGQAQSGPAGDRPTPPANNTRQREALGATPQEHNALEAALRAGRPYDTGPLKTEEGAVDRSSGVTVDAVQGVLGTEDRETGKTVWARTRLVFRLPVQRKSVKRIEVLSEDGAPLALAANPDFAEPFDTGEPLTRLDAYVEHSPGFTFRLRIYLKEPGDPSIQR